MSATTAFACDGCGRTETFDYVNIRKPWDWGSFALAGPGGITNMKQVPMAEWRRDVADKIYCPSCIAKMTGRPLPEEKAA